MKKLTEEQKKRYEKKTTKGAQKSTLINKLSRLKVGEALFVKKIELKNSGYKSPLRNLIAYYQRRLNKNFSTKLLEDKDSYLVERVE